MLKSICDLKVESVLVSSLVPNPLNTRIHSKRQIQQIAKSIRNFGWRNPLLIAADGRIIAGHGRMEAAKILGLESVPVIRVEDMSEAQRRAYAIADNKLTENAGWNRELLALEFKALFDLEPNFDITSTGFEVGEGDVIIRDLGEAEDEADQVPEIDPAAPVISQGGDLWALGPHRLLCADATKPESYARLLGGNRAQMIFADPPYNVKIPGNVSGLGAVRHSNFAMASGEMSETEFTNFLATICRLLSAHSVDGAIQYICMDWRHLAEALSAGRGAYKSLENLCVWQKTNAAMGSLYRSQHELVLVFKNGKAPHINNVQLGKHGRNRSNVWVYRGMNSFGAERDELLAMHPTIKPVALVEDAILDCSNRNGIILDPFLGSGTTLIAAQRAGRRGFGLEIDPRYVDVALRRFRDVTGIEPVHAESGRTFKDLEEERGSPLSAANEPETNDGEKARCESPRSPTTATKKVTTLATASRRSTPVSSPDNPGIQRAGRKARTTSKRTSKRRLRRR